MIFDSRIKSEDDIFHYFNRKNAAQYIGKPGYFADYLTAFKDKKFFEEFETGVLSEINDNQESCYIFGGTRFGFKFFIPAELAEEKSKKKSNINFEAYNLVTLENEFNIGDVVTFRGKSNTDRAGSYYKCVYSGYRFFTEKGSTNIIAIFGLWGFSFSELLDLYEIYREGTWEPFGRKVETIDLNVI